MAYGFSQPIGGAVSTADAPNALPSPTSEILFHGATLAPGFYLVTNDTSAFESVIITMYFNGNPAFPAATGDFGLVEAFWYSSALVDPGGSIEDNLLWVDTWEVPSRYTPGFTGPTKSFVRLPVQGKRLLISFNSGSGGAGSPSWFIRILGSRTVLGKSIFGNDRLSNKCTDLIVLSRSGGVLTPGTADTLEFGGLASGPAQIRYVANFAAAGVSCRFRGFWGSDPTHGPEDIVLTSAAVGQTLSTSRLVQIPRRPLLMFAQNITAAGNVNSYNFHVVRDEP